MSKGLTREVGAPLHHQLFGVLRSAIMSGRYGHGEYLPGEVFLMEEFGVSRGTVRRALLTLEADGLIEREQGRGTRVIWRAPTNATLERLRLVERSAKGSTVKVLDYARVVAPSEVMTALELPSGAHVLRIIRVRSRKGRPVWHLVNYVTDNAAEQLTRAALERRTLIEELRRTGHGIHRVEDQVGAVLAEPEVARALQIRAGAPLLEILRVMFDAQRVPIAYQVTLIPPEQRKLRIVIEGLKEIGPAGAPGILKPAGSETVDVLRRKAG